MPLQHSRKKTNPTPELMLHRQPGALLRKRSTHLVAAPPSFAEAFWIARSSAVTASRRASTAAACFLSKKSINRDSTKSGVGDIRCTETL